LLQLGLNILKMNKDEKSWWDRGGEEYGTKA
jgi:hypothetical protein